MSNQENIALIEHSIALADEGCEVVAELVNSSQLEELYEFATKLENLLRPYRTPVTPIYKEAA